MMLAFVSIVLESFLVCLAQCFLLILVALAARLVDEIGYCVDESRQVHCTRLAVVTLLHDEQFEVLL